MAGEVGHVIYAARLLTYLRDTVHDPLYWVGTLFPDVRHLGRVSRRRTHPAQVSLHSLAGPTDFETGLRVHTWIDATREKFLDDTHIKEYLPWHPLVPYALNLLEDELLYQYFDDWNLIHRLLNTVHESERTYVTERSVIERWHTLLQAYFAAAPTPTTRRALLHGLNLSDHLISECESTLQLLKKDARATKVLEKFWQRLEDILR